MADYIPVIIPAIPIRRRMRWVSVILHRIQLTTIVQLWFTNISAVPSIVIITGLTTKTDQNIAVSIMQIREILIEGILEGIFTLAAKIVGDISLIVNTHQTVLVIGMVKEGGKDEVMIEMGVDAAMTFPGIGKIA